jgi:hypothetical protein
MFRGRLRTNATVMQVAEPITATMGNPTGAPCYRNQNLDGRAALCCSPCYQPTGGD